MKFDKDTKLNLYLPRYFDAHADLVISSIVKGKFQVAICRNGQVIRKPFGENWIPNVICNGALDYAMQNNLYQIGGYGAFARGGSGLTAPAITDTQLTTQLRSSNTQFTGGGAGTIISTSNDTVNGAVTFTNVFEFAAETSTVTYNEIGLASTAGPTGGILFTHSLLPSGVTCNNGDNLRLTYAMTFSMPSTVTPVTVSLAAVGGFNVSGQMKCCGTFLNIFGSMGPGPGISGGNDSYMRAANAGQAFLVSAPSTFPAVNTAITYTTLGSAVNGSLAGYTVGSYTRSGTWQWIPSNPPATQSNVQGLIITPGGVTNVGMYLLFTALQTKANTNTLTITFASTIARA